jgi:hypothetical protein
MVTCTRAPVMRRGSGCRTIARSSVGVSWRAEHYDDENPQDVFLSAADSGGELHRSLIVPAVSGARAWRHGVWRAGILPGRDAIFSSSERLRLQRYRDAPHIHTSRRPAGPSGSLFEHDRCAPRAGVHFARDGSHHRDIDTRTREKLDDHGGCVYRGGGQRNDTGVAVSGT